MLASLRSVFSLMLSTSLMMVGFGLASYVLPVRSVAEGWSTLVISWIATGYTLGFTISCVITPKFVARVGHVRVFAALITLLSVAILMCGLVVDWRAWIFFRAISGFAISGSYLVIESWLNERVTNENRGMLFSLYLITTMLGTIGGQYLVPLGDPTNSSLFILCGVLFSLALLPTALSSSAMPAPPTQAKFDVPGLYRRSPVAVVGAFLAGAMSGAWLNLGGVFTQKIGLSTAEGATLLAALLAGSAVSQIPIGRTSDRMDRRIVMVGCGIVGVISCLAMVAFVGAGPLVLYVIAAFVGSVLFPIYALNVAHANDLARPNEYVEVSSGMMITYGMGTISGPLMVGPVMDKFGPASLFLVLAIYFALYAAYAAWRIAQRSQHDGLVAKTDFQANTVPTPGTEAVNAMNQAARPNTVIEDDTAPPRAS
ncbi:MULTISPECIES: MFS transporter [unclassified Rhizobium]|uniref:MFS transporter n=1 Tax=unclassified Rhizobium TaxID=2613769 RepID=UPI000712E5F4|nr:MULTISPECIES: MFS transporter [unclassified Rhizobium]KQS96511.1 MFS transporter [Rhizobium sp. Leaf386]KQT06350.1 MFS transporter [Rhizobium sp. Leaf391]KQT92420.1 MFS transporter [Rhizobium sp. Leaf453]